MSTIVEDALRRLRKGDDVNYNIFLEGSIFFVCEFDPYFSLVKHNPAEIERAVEENWNRVKEQARLAGREVFNGERVGVKNWNFEPSPQYRSERYTIDLSLPLVKSDYAHYKFGEQTRRFPGVYELGVVGATVSSDGGLVFGVREGTGTDDGKVSLIPAGGVELNYVDKEFTDKTHWKRRTVSSEDSRCGIRASLFEELKEETGISCDETSKISTVNFADNLYFNLAITYLIRTDLTSDQIRERYDGLEKREYEKGLTLVPLRIEDLARFVLEAEAIEAHSASVLDTLLSVPNLI